MTRQQRRHLALGVLGVLLIAGLGMVALRPRGDDVRVVTVLTTAGGALAPGADVRVDGLPVGSVESLETQGDDVRVILSVHRRAADELPATVTARVMPATVFGTSYVDLRRPQRSAGSTTLASARTVAQDTSVPTLELQRALDGIDRLVTALGPARISTVLHSLASALDGRGRTIGASVDRLGHLSRGLRPLTGVIRDDLVGLADNLATVRRIAPDLLDALDDVTVVSDDVVRGRGDLSRTLIAALRALDAGDTLVQRTGKDLPATLAGLAVIVDALFDHRSDLTRGPVALDRLLRRVVQVTEGGAIRIDATIVNASGYGYYTAADCPRYEAQRGANCRGSSR